jgi:hypothetical protein
MTTNNSKGYLFRGFTQTITRKENELRGSKTCKVYVSKKLMSDYDLEPFIIHRCPAVKLDGKPCTRWDDSCITTANVNLENPVFIGIRYNRNGESIVVAAKYMTIQGTCSKHHSMLRTEQEVRSQRMAVLKANQKRWNEYAATLNQSRVDQKP